MKKYLLPHNARYYKANLHAHTVLSDGKKTPEQVRADYMKNGYSVVAFTDHDKYCPHNELTDGSFLALNGFELEYYRVPWKQKTAHLCFIAKTPDTFGLGYSPVDAPVFLRELPEGGLDPEEGGLLYTVTCPGRKYTPEYINADIKRAKELGFFVTYNHPGWSLESYPDYAAYRGMDAMEIANFNCLTEGYEDDNGRVYDDMLRLGNRISCIAADDNHNDFPDGSERSDSYGGYIMLAAEELSYGAVIKALEKGDFYACGRVNPGAEGDCPLIRELWAEEGNVHIETTPAAHISLIKDLRPFGIAIAKAGEPLTKADFKIGACTWFRVAVTGFNGCKAYSRAYFTDEL